MKNSIGQNFLGMKYMPLSIDVKSLFSTLKSIFPEYCSIVG